MKKRFIASYIWADNVAELSVKIDDFMNHVNKKDFIGISNIIAEWSYHSIYKYIVLIYHYQEEKK